MSIYFKTSLGTIHHDDALNVLRAMEESSVNLVVTSPPYALVRPKGFENASAIDYVAWFAPFAREILRILADDGSFVLNLGSGWTQGQPTKTLYSFEVLLFLVRELGFHLAQDFYWWKPAKPPAPTEWVTVKRVRVKDAVEQIWWLSKTPNPKANNREVLQPYSEAHLAEVRRGRSRKGETRPSGYKGSDTFGDGHGGSIPPNLIAAAGADAHGHYMRRCRECHVEPHPTRFPTTIPEYFIRFLTNENDLVVDPFAGSCTTGEVAERLGRRWTCIDEVEAYLIGAKFRFESPSTDGRGVRAPLYTLPHPRLGWRERG